VLTASRQRRQSVVPAGAFGNAGVGIVRGPGMNRFDLSLGKKLPSPSAAISNRAARRPAGQHGQLGLHHAVHDAAGKS
jgi:hypothetical protein